MSTMQIKGDVTVEDVQRVLSNELGTRYRVSAGPDLTLKIGRTGVIPSKLTLRHRDDTTTVQLQTTGLIVSRVIQAASINPRVRRALEHAYPDTNSIG